MPTKTRNTSRRPLVPARVALGPISVDSIEMAGVLERMRTAVAQGAPLHVVTANMQFLWLAARDTAFASLVNRAGLVVGDGVPLIWLSRLRGNPIPERITGHDLVDACAAMAAANGLRIGLLGGSSDAAETAAGILLARHSGLAIAGIFNGTFDSDGTATSAVGEVQTETAIRQARPDILFVALGCPKQERWIDKHISSLGVPVCIGVGSVFDVLAGQHKRAPTWMQRSGLEWSYRFSQEPRRLWRRYLAEDLPMLARTAVTITTDRLRHRSGRS